MPAFAVLQDRGDALVWPLYRRIDQRSGMPVISGFVVARVVGYGRKDGGYFVLLQPAQRAISAVVTASSRQRVCGRNRYLGRVRLADEPALAATPAPR
jgi:hypothetical protein